MKTNTRPGKLGAFRYKDGLSPVQKNRVEAGGCYICSKPLATQRQCREHADKTVLAASRKRKRRLNAGLCDRCGGSKGSDGNMHNCRACAELNSEASGRYHRQRQFNLSPHDYDAMVTFQNGRCAICLTVPRNRRLAVDHCHKSGKVRQLLCSNCNTGLGFFADNPETLQRAAKYLSAHS